MRDGDVCEPAPRAGALDLLAGLGPSAATFPAPVTAAPVVGGLDEVQEPCVSLRSLRALVPPAVDAEEAERLHEVRPVRIGVAQALDVGEEREPRRRRARLDTQEAGERRVTVADNDDDDVLEPADVLPQPPVPFPRARRRRRRKVVEEDEDPPPEKEAPVPG